VGRATGGLGALAEMEAARPGQGGGTMAGVRRRSPRPRGERGCGRGKGKKELAADGGRWLRRWGTRAAYGDTATGRCG
jgi:hypothetical protein